MTKNLHYKIVSIVDDRLWSYTGMSIEGNVEYFVNGVTLAERGNGPLAVFASLEEAKKFMIKEGNILGWEISEGYAIYSCYITESTSKSLWYRSGDGNLISIPSTLFPLPKGTILADSVILLEKVDSQ
jgi:hypothetical protein